MLSRLQLNNQPPIYLRRDHVRDCRDEPTGSQSQRTPGPCKLLTIDLHLRREPKADDLISQMPHVHLVSSFRYPSVSHINLQDAAKWLMQAPHVARDKAPFFWTYLDKPADGTILMTWQPLQRLGTNFATDGFVWAPPEQVFKHDLNNGLLLEIYYLKAGYIPGEQFAQHARRRFRLVPVPGHPIQHQPDTNLFLVHYGPSEPNEALPAQIVPYDQRVHTAMQQRQFLLRAGQIRRKEFMLSDRANWPSLPELTRQQVEPQMAPRGVPQHMAYPPQGVAGPPAKRARHAPSQGQAPPIPGVTPLEGAFDDDEDTSRGDMFDHLTPREISLGRYQQNHEWMEEILSSPYRVNQITPADLGLGLKGSLASLTEGIFTAQGGDAFNQAPEKPYIGRLDPEKAEEFRKRVDEHIRREKEELEAMRKAHDEELASMRQKSKLIVREKELRTVEDAGSELWRPHDGADIRDESFKKTVEDIVQEIESSTGRKVQSQPAVKCVQNGGYQAPAPEPVAPQGNTQMSRQPSSQNSGILIGESDIDMGGTAAGLLDQMHTGFSSTSTPLNSFPTPQAQGFSAVQSNTATPLNPANAPSPAIAQPQRDISMGGTAPDAGTGSGDWVVVPKDSNTPDPTAAASRPLSKPLSAAATPGGFDGNDFGSLGDLDTAGDALAGFDTPSLGEGLDLQMDMEDSAFGDAFHGVGGSASGTPGQDM